MYSKLIIPTPLILVIIIAMIVIIPNTIIRTECILLMLIVIDMIFLTMHILIHNRSQSQLKKNIFVSIGSIIIILTMIILSEIVARYLNNSAQLQFNSNM